MKKLVAEALPFQSLQDSWEQFVAGGLSDAHPDELDAMHTAFFSGASTAYLLFIKSLQAPSKSESRALAQALFKEIDEFMKSEMFSEIQPEGNA